MLNFFCVLPAHAHQNSQKKKHKEKKNKEVKNEQMSCSGSK